MRPDKFGRSAGPSNTNHASRVGLPRHRCRVRELAATDANTTTDTRKLLFGFDSEFFDLQLFEMQTIPVRETRIAEANLLFCHGQDSFFYLGRGRRASLSSITETIDSTENTFRNGNLLRL